MSHLITIAGKNATVYLRNNSLKWNTAKNGMPDTLTFSIDIPGYIYYPDPPLPEPNNLIFDSENFFTFDSGNRLLMQGEAPPPPEPPVEIDDINENDEIVFTIDSVLRFSGNVVDVEKSGEGTIRSYTISCQDPSYNSKKGELIAQIYKKQTVDSIIAELLNLYPQLAGYTNTNVDCPIIIKYAFFDHLTFPEVLKRLSRDTGYNFYIDKNKDIHFNFNVETASFNVTNTNGKTKQHTLKFREEGSKLKNLILLQGGEYNASEISFENYTANGSDLEFPIVGDYSGVTVKIDTVKINTGASGIHDPNDYDCLYDFSGKKIIFQDGSQPTVGQNMEISGYQKLPVFVQVEDQTSIDALLASGDVTGIRGKKITDYSIKTIDSALQVAQAELDQLKETQVSGGFSTYDLELRAGQKINIVHSLLGIDEDYYIQKTSTSFHGLKFITQVTIAKADKIDAIGILARLLADQKKTVTASEALQLFKRFREEILISDVLEVDSNKKSIDEGIIMADSLDYEENKTLLWVVAPYTPTGFADSKREMRLNVSPCVT